MKKIGIMTSSYAGNGTYGCNYGAALQGYALVKQLRMMGYEAYDINYNSSYVYNPKQYGKIKRFLLRVTKIFNIAIVKGKIRSIQNKDNIAVLRNKFSIFVKQYELTYENGKFFTIEELNKISDSFYAFITGSDVVWNPFLHKNQNDKGFFLDFTKKGVKRIAYAPSTGVTVFPEAAKKDLRELLLKFDALSVREQSGANLLKNITGIDVQVVIDPTMLLNSIVYDEIIAMPPNIPENYILVYKFGDIQHTVDSINDVKRVLKLPIIYIPAGEYEKNVCPIYDAGPNEFVGLIKNAKVVLTDSFHCTVFCLLYHTPFFTFYRSLPSNGRDLNSRVIDLLEMVGLKDRLVLPDTKIEYSKIDSIDFTHCDKVLERNRLSAINYLKEALN